MTPAPTITDPQAVPTYSAGLLSRLISAWCARALYDARDEVFVRLTLRAIATQVLAMGALYAALRFSHLPAPIPMLAYLLLWAWSTPPIILMLHCTMHRKFIRAPRLLDEAHPFVMSFFYGMPMGFREHHIGMHHIEDNMGEDLSSTLRYRRDSFWHFLHYFSRFYCLVAYELPKYLNTHKRARLARRALYAELAQWTVVLGSLALFDWRFALTAFVLPCVLCRFTMMVGNWGQHAFINTALPNDGFSNAITCINTTYNARCFNDGYHIGHHVSAKRHWTELPADFIANRELYARRGVIVFEGLDFFMVSLLLWLGAWKVLAKHFVRLGEPMTDEQVIALLQARVQPVRAWEAEGIGLPSAAE